MWEVLLYYMGFNPFFSTPDPGRSLPLAALNRQENIHVLAAFTSSPPGTPPAGLTAVRSSVGRRPPAARRAPRSSEGRARPNSRLQVSDGHLPVHRFFRGLPAPPRPPHLRGTQEQDRIIRRLPREPVPAAGRSAMGNRPTGLPRSSGSRVRPSDSLQFFRRTPPGVRVSDLVRATQGLTMVSGRLLALGVGPPPHTRPRPLAPGQVASLSLGWLSGPSVPRSRLGRPQG
ncbi:hypothetical protein NDU88_001442 [Pleurodeles waltl]|uniref:Uncharacterized protein n=1 Tax=Pleurodeles waltl TaxID=8319 RepID=A0AAV7P5I5_PLEWA|nr:hypothetical protein NDU88_001442 [Pleurodeles waltl]